MTCLTHPLGALTLRLCPLILPLPSWLVNGAEPRLQHLSAPLRGTPEQRQDLGDTGHPLGEPGLGGVHWHILEILRVWCPGREPCPCGMLRLASQGLRATTASFCHLSSTIPNVFSCSQTAVPQVALWTGVAVNRPEPISQQEHLVLCAMAKAEPTSPASRLAAEGCRGGGKDLSALKLVAVAGRYCWMAGFHPGLW